MKLAKTPSSTHKSETSDEGAIASPKAKWYRLLLWRRSKKHGNEVMIELDENR